MEMQIPYMRAGIDRAYNAELNDLDEKHWSENADDERCIKLGKQVYEFKAKMLASDAKLAKYPVDFGKGDKLNDKGNRLVMLMTAAHKARSMIKQGSSESSWWTYRDVLDPSKFVSLHDNTTSLVLSKHWMDLKVEKGNCKIESVI